MKASFTVPGQPVPKARARAGKRGHYTPKATRDYERAIGLCWEAHRPSGWPLDARYKIYVVATFSDNRCRDLDNVLKSVCDGLNGKAWTDDHRVDQMSILRVHGDDPRAEIFVEVVA